MAASSRVPASSTTPAGLPPLAALLAYNAAAFGSPLHLSYRYEAPPFSEQQHHGFFGIGVPTLHGLEEVLIGDRGLLLFSPVLVLAAVGLWLLWRQGQRLEAGVAVVPGTSFGPGGEGHVRISFATSLGEIEEGLKRIRAVAASARGGP